MDQQKFKQNLVLKQVIQYTLQCTNLCKGYNSEYITPQLQQCLRSCGYNKAFMINSYRKLQQQAKYSLK